MSDDATEVTRAFTGSPARAIRNRFVAEMVGAEALEFPLQASIVGPLWQVPDDHARAELMPVWSGQAAALMRELPARELVDRLVRETQSVLVRST